MRRFVLFNANGEKYDLNDLNFYFHSPEGLGFKKETKFFQVGDRYIPYNNRISQPKPAGIIRFKNPNAYSKYYEFARFISKTPLVLKYSPENVDYNIDCIVTALDKSEIEGKGLSCKIELSALSPYYRTFLMTSDNTSEGKRYAYSFPYRYASIGAGSVALDVDTNMDSPTKIYIYGPAKNPVWTYYLDNVVRGRGLCNIDLRAGRVLAIDTTQVPYSITEQDTLGNIIYDRYGDADLETERFIFMKKGRNRITVSQDEISIPRIKVEARLYYETV